MIPNRKQSDFDGLCGQHVLPFLRCQFADINRNQFDIERILDGVPDDIATIVEFKPAPIGVVPAR